MIGSPFNEVDFSDAIYKVPLASSFTIEAKDGKLYCLNKGQSGNKIDALKLSYFS